MFSQVSAIQHFHNTQSNPLMQLARARRAVAWAPWHHATPVQRIHVTMHYLKPAARATTSYCTPFRASVPTTGAACGAGCRASLLSSPPRPSAWYRSARRTGVPSAIFCWTKASSSERVSRLRSAATLPASCSSYGTAADGLGPGVPPLVAGGDDERSRATALLLLAAALQASAGPLGSLRLDEGLAVAVSVAPLEAAA